MQPSSIYPDKNGQKNAFLNVFTRECRRIAARPLLLCAVLVLPLFSLLFMATIFRNGQMTELPIGIVDKTDSEFSREIIRSVAAVPAFRIEDKHFYPDESAARQALQEMEIYAYLVIPSELDTKTFNREDPGLIYYYQNGQLSIGEQVRAGFTSALASIASSLPAGTALRGGLSSRQIEPVVLPLVPSAFPLYNPALNFSVYLSYPFFFVFFQILILVITVYAVGSELTEKKENDSGWLAAARGGIVPAVAGKLAPYLLVFFVQTMFAVFVFFGPFRIPFSGSWIPFLLSGWLLVIASAAVGVLATAILPGLALPISFASMFGALGATLCGVTFPIENMYPAVDALSRLFPIRYFTRILHETLYTEAGFSTTWSGFALLAAFLLPALLVLPRLRRKFSGTGRQTKPPYPAASPTTSPPNYFLKELQAISRHYGVLLIVLGGTIGYGILYNLMYRPNLVENIPAAVVDHSRTPFSRQFIRDLDATQGIRIQNGGADFREALRWMKEGKIRGIFYLPPDFSERFLRGEESVFRLYASTASFLYYSTLQESALNVLQQTNDRIRTDVVSTLPLEAQLLLSQAPSLTITGRPLYNTNGGYGSFLIPVVLIIILFQTLLMAVGSIGGSIREDFRDNTGKYLIKNSRGDIGEAAAALCGRSSAYILLYFLLSFFVVGLLPPLFSLPALGNAALLFPFILLFLAAGTLFAAALSALFRDSEEVMLLVPFFSVGLLFLTGASFPFHGLGKFWQYAAWLFPTTPGVAGFIKINSFGGDLSVLLPELRALLLQTGGYFILALVLFRRRPEYRK